MTVSANAGHPCKISLSIHASDEGAFIEPPLDPPTTPSLSVPDQRRSCRADDYGGSMLLTSVGGSTKTGEESEMTMRTEIRRHVVN